MRLFVFKIHEDCSYVSGAILIKAESYDRAEELYHKLGREESRFSEFRNPIFDHRPERLDEKMCYNDPWYLAHTLEIDDTEEGILMTVYHSG